MLSQIFVLLLCLDAALVAYGLMKKRNMWPYIVAYWVLLTAKNIIDFAKVWA